MPSAPPSSAAVSEIPDAAPAFSAGAEPTTISVVRPNTGPMPERDHHRRDDELDQAVVGPAPGSARPARRPPRPARRPPRWPAGSRDSTRGASCEPTTKPTAPGTDHSPASSGDMPEHQLQVLGDVEQVADHHEDRHEVDQQRDVEARGSGTARRRSSGRPAGAAGAPTASPTTAPAAMASTAPVERPVLGDLLEAVDHGQQGEHRHRGADQVQPARRSGRGTRAAPAGRAPAGRP